MHFAFLTSPGWQLNWAHGCVSVQALGGMIAPLEFRFANGQTVSPLHVAPWGAVEDAALPGVLRKLRGEWPCVPFGASRPPPGLPADWQTQNADDGWDHGFTANHDWHLVEQTQTLLKIAIDYPPGHAIRRLERTIRPDPNAASVEVLLTVFARAATQMPVALHPTFVVPPEGVELLAPPASRIYTYPVPTEPQVSRLRPNTFGTTLSAMPSDEGPLDFTRLPLPFATEELMQLVDCQPPFRLRYPHQAVEVKLDWDSQALPDALVWISNGGRAHAPWSGRHYALGIEPMSGFFDLGRVVVPTDGHPLAKNKGIVVDPLHPFEVRYALSATQI